MEESSRDDSDNGVMYDDKEMTNMLMHQANVAGGQSYVHRKMSKY